MVDPCVSMGGDLSQSSLEEREYLPWLALARVNGLGNAGCKKVVEYCGDPRSVLSASEGELPEVTGLEKEAIEGIRAIENHLIPGKIIVYPSCEGLGLISLDEMREKLPEMTARLTDGLWNAEAEKKLLEMY